MEERESPVGVVSGTYPAPYGRACVNCSKAKCKCMHRAEGVSCERCHRLKKQCQPSQPVRKRNPPPRRSAAQLEDKIADLVELLKVAQDQRGPLPPATASAAVASLITPASSAKDTSTESSTTSSHAADSPSSASCRTEPPMLSVLDRGNAVLASVTVDAEEAAEPDREEAEECFRRFRDHYLKYFPFYNFSPDDTAASIRKKMPLFWLSIMAVSATSARRRGLMFAKFKRLACYRYVMETDLSLELLFGTLVYINWAHLVKKDKPFMSVFMQLALFLVYERGFNKGSLPASFLMMCIKPLKDGTCSFVGERTPTMEERRAVLATYILSSSLSHNMKRLEPMRFTTHMGECLRILSEQPEWSGDRVLAVQVRLRLVLDQAQQMEAQQCMFGDVGSAKGPGPTVSMMFGNALRAKFEEIEASVPPDLREDKGVTTAIATTEFILDQSCVSQPPWDVQKPSPSVNLDRLRSLQRCLESLQKFFDIISTLDGAELMYISFSLYSYLAHALMSLYAITMMDEPGWDRASVRATVDLIEWASRFIKMMEEAVVVRKMVVEPGEHDIFGQSVTVFTRLRESWQAEFDAKDNRAPQRPSAPGNMDSQSLSANAQPQEQQQQSQSHPHQHVFQPSMLGSMASMPPVHSGLGDVEMTHDMNLGIADDMWLSEILMQTWEDPAAMRWMPQ